MGETARLPEIEGCLVRPITEADKPALRTAFKGDHEYFEVINGREIALEEVCSHVPSGSAPDDKFLFVIEQGGQVAGMIDLIRDHPEVGVWHLGFLYVVDGFRGGMGRRALRGLYPWLKAQGARVVRLGVVEPNVRARHLYATEGFAFESCRDADPSVKRMRRTLVLRRAL